MRIRVDVRETALLNQINALKSNVPLFKDLEVVIETLPLGDIIITDANGEDKIIVERKSLSDLSASIKDGRYEEQSYRLNGLNHPNHNIIYLIEGDVNKLNGFRDTRIDKLTLYSAIFSLNYFKGFSVIRTLSLEETAIFICNTAKKLIKEGEKRAYYTITNTTNTNKTTEDKTTEDKTTEDDVNVNSISSSSLLAEEKDYVSVVKKVKKENITPENIGEIMLCQIPGISSVTAIAIMEKYKSLHNLITCVQADENCLKDISYMTAKNQSRKINKTCIVNIIKYLVK
jgi:ERCC4-type nuclease